MSDVVAPNAQEQQKVSHWSAYNKALVDRGDLRVFVTQKVLDSWRATTRGKNGRPATYSDEAIKLVLTLRTLLNLTLRRTEGLTKSLFQEMGVDLPVPNYTTLHRRMKALSVEFETTVNEHIGMPIDLVFDSTGIKIRGRGEWKTKPPRPALHRALGRQEV